MMSEVTVEGPQWLLFFLKMRPPEEVSLLGCESVPCSPAEPEMGWSTSRELREPVF